MSSLPSIGSSATPSGDYPTEPGQGGLPSRGRRRLGVILVIIGLLSLVTGAVSLAARHAGNQQVTGQPVVDGPPSPGPHPDWTTLFNPTSGLSYQMPSTGWHTQDTAGQLGQVQLSQGGYFNPYTCGNPAKGYQRGALGSGSAPKADPTVLATTLATTAATNYYTPPGSTASPMLTVSGPEPVQRTLPDGDTVDGIQVEAIADQQTDPCLASEGEVLVLVLALPDRDAVLVVNGDTEGGPATPPPATADDLQAILDTATPTGH